MYIKNGIFRPYKKGEFCGHNSQKRKRTAKRGRLEKEKAEFTEV